MSSPVIAFTIHDPDGVIFPHLWKIKSTLKDNFFQAFVGITPTTLENQKYEIDKLEGDKFFEITYNQKDSQIGDHFVSLWQRLVKVYPLDTRVHLATEDRLAFILGTDFKKQVLKDFKLANKIKNPVLFQRSDKAWSTHPKNYLAAESMTSLAGKVLFNKYLDFFWCHLVLEIVDLKEILPKIESHDLTVFTEIVLSLLDRIMTKKVDWLSWEDPFILGKDPQKYKLERERSREETDKRLNYVYPAIKMLFKKYYFSKQNIL